MLLGGGVFDQEFAPVGFAEEPLVGFDAFDRGIEGEFAVFKLVQGRGEAGHRLYRHLQFGHGVEEFADGGLDGGAESVGVGGGIEGAKKGHLC